MLPAYDALHWILEDIEGLGAEGEDVLVKKARVELRGMELLRRKLAAMRSRARG